MAETENFEAAAYTALGTPRERVPLPAPLFDGTVNMPVMHQAVKAFLANQRQGTAMTKTRSWVTGGNQKPWRQKGTGRARQGSTRAPHWVGGGTVFGPIPRSYEQRLPKQMKALARKSALNARAREGAIYVIDQFAWDAPKTSRLVATLARLGVADRKVLILTDGVKPNVYLSGRNIGTVQVMPYGDVSTYHILWSDVVLIEAGALGQTLAPVAEQEPTETPKAARPARPARKRATAAEGEGETRKAAPAKKKAATKKTATRKSAAKSATKRPAAKKAATKKSAAKTPAARKGAAKKKGK